MTSVAGRPVAAVHYRDIKGASCPLSASQYQCFFVRASLLFPHALWVSQQMHATYRAASGADAQVHASTAMSPAKAVQPQVTGATEISEAATVSEHARPGNTGMDLRLIHNLTL